MTDCATHLFEGNVLFVILDVEDDDLARLKADSDGVENRRAGLEAQDRGIPTGKLVQLFARPDVP